jgi:hypothetical protein
LEVVEPEVMVIQRPFLRILLLEQSFAVVAVVVVKE